MNREIQREPSEWCRMWWSEADGAERRRILLIGDSITVGYADLVIGALKEWCAGDYLATSRSINDPGLRELVSHMLGEHHYDFIHFNNGLHGWHLEDDAYRWHLCEWVRFMRWYAPSARLVWANSTPVTVIGDTTKLHPEYHPIVQRRNLIAAEEMLGFGIPVNDLFTAVEGETHLRLADGFHYNEAGNIVLGNAVTRVLGELFKKPL